MNSQQDKTFLYSVYVIFIASLFLFYKYILQISPSIMSHQLIQAFSLHATGLGNLAAAYFYSYVIMQLFAGPIIDRFHPGRVAAVAILSCALGAFIFSKASSFSMAFSGRVVMGIGVAFATVSYMKVASLYCKPQYYAFVSGLLVTAAMAGAIFGETPLVILMQYTGWRNLLLGAAIFGVVLALIFSVSIKKNDKHAVVVVNKKIEWRALKKLVMCRQNWLLTFYSGLAFAPLAVLGGLWANPFFQTTHNMTLVQSSLLVSSMFLGMGLGSPILGWLSDKKRNHLSVMKSGVLISLLCLIIIVYDTQLNLIILSLLMFSFGFFSGAFMIGFAVAKDLNSLALTATVVAMINTGDELLSGLTEPLVGKVLDLHWRGAIVDGVQQFNTADFHVAFIVLPCYLILSYLMLLGIKQPSDIPCAEQPEILR